MSALDTAPIAPFQWLENDDGSATVFMEADGYKDHIFQTREEEGFVGNGYDWASLIQVFLQERHSALQEDIELDPEAGAIFILCNAPENARHILHAFIAEFIDLCENDEAAIRDLFSRTAID